jgi:hypothetical protein
MRPHGLRSSVSRVAMMHAIWVAPLTASLLSASACAHSNDEPPSNAPETTSVVPGADAGDEASLTDGKTDTDVIPTLCAVGNLCRVASPLTIGSVTSIAGRSKSDVWASASLGLLMHWNGQSWKALESTTTETLSSVFLTPTEMWGVSGRLIVRRGMDRNSIQALRPLPTAMRHWSGVAVLPTGEAYVSNGPMANSYTDYQLLGALSPDNQQIDFLPDPVIESTDQIQLIPVRALHLVPNKAIWLVGDRGGVARYGISPLRQGVVLLLDTPVDLLSAWGYDDHLWVAGAKGSILHFDGAVWRPWESGTTVTLNAIFGLSPTDIWAAGNEGTVLHFDGNGWSRIDIPGYIGDLRAIWGASPDDVWIGGTDGLLHWGVLP